ncbi:MAG: T9SS type A sorting domain-containing protein [Bacteroidia bacterium]|nr:T9SS type A sorting domain-containing protein [Bacteroidia bacterium]
MKQFLLFVSAVSLSLTGIMAQTQDAPLHPHSTLTASPFPEKALSYGEYCGYSLLSTTTTGNGNEGVMFMVKAKTNLVISGFTTVLNGTPGYVHIYRKNGSFDGFESFAAAWTLIDSAYVAPTGQQTFIPVNAGNFLTAGAEMSYYIVGRSPIQVDYTNGVTEGAVYAQNNDLIFYEGVGIDGMFGSIFTPRVFAGYIHYCKQTELRCDSSSTTFGDLNSNYGIFFDVTTKSKDIKIDNIFADMDLPSGGRLQVYTRQGTFAGSESNPAAWTLVDSSFISFPIPNAPEAVTDSMSLVIPSNTTQGFHIVFKNIGYVNYNNGTTMGNVMFEDSLLQIKTGAGADAPFISNNQPRNFQGTISYCIMEYAGLAGESQEKLRIWPNPASDVLNLAGIQGKQDVQIMDISGKTVMLIANYNGGSIPVHTLARGTYIIRVKSDKHMYSERFIKL